MESEEILETVRQSLLCLLEETLHSHQGVYTDEGTSLIETLETIDADLASRKFAGHAETIAGHVNHARYYLTNSLEMFQGKGTGDFDVAESWKVGQVSAAEWAALKAELQNTYKQVMAYTSRISDAEIRNFLPALLGMIAHSSYHLGAIRQFKDLK